MKKLYALFVALFAVMLLSVPAMAAEMPISVYLDGIKLGFDVDPVMIDGRTLVPMRAIFEALGAEVSWDGDTRTAIAVKDGTSIEISIDDPEMKKNGEIITLDVPAQLVDSRTMVPVRAVSEGMEATVKWFDAVKYVYIFTGIGEGDYPMYSLSPADMEILKSRYDEMRFFFEMNILPQRVYDSMGEIANGIYNVDIDLRSALKTMWNQVVAAYVRDVQANSSDNYVMLNGITENDETLGYFMVVDEAGLEADEVFDVTFLIWPKNIRSALLTFNDTVPFDNANVTGSAKYVMLSLIDTHVNSDDELDNFVFYYFIARSDADYPDDLVFSMIMSNLYVNVGPVGGTSQKDFEHVVDAYFDSIKENHPSLQ